MKYPFVREDSHWKDPAKSEPESIQEDESAATPQASSSIDWNRFLEPSTPLFYIPCLDSDESQEGCFQMGNFRVRKPSSSKKPQLTEEAVPTNDVEQDSLVDQDAPIEQDTLVEQDAPVEQEIEFGMPRLSKALRSSKERQIRHS
jgi:hypothetical protein